jgi:sporulation protein YlmC with PRC-barrel domain
MQAQALSASTITGDNVRNLEGDDLGHIEELVIDLDSGRINYAVLSSGGFLGLGNKLFAIPWDMLTVDTDSKEVVIDLSKETLENAPGFDKDNWPDIHDGLGLATCTAITGATLTGKTFRWRDATASEAYHRDLREAHPRLVPVPLSP